LDYLWLSVQVFIRETPSSLAGKTPDLIKDSLTTLIRSKSIPAWHISHSLFPAGRGLPFRNLLVVRYRYEEM